MTVLDSPRVAGALSPPLKWAGGKGWLVPALKGLWVGYEESRLVEPFAGGLSVTLGLSPNRALLNDINGHLVNFYKWLQKGLAIESRLLNEKGFYYESRRRFNELVTGGSCESREAAELFYFLNRTGYNGLCRFNKKGEFNVPFGRYRTINYASDFLAYKPLFCRWEFMSLDYASLAIESTDFVYADPPYDVAFTSYSENDFGWAEQVQLAHWLKDLAVPVVASNQATDRILELYGDLGFSIQTLKAPRRISCNGDRRPAVEMLATCRL